MNTDIEARLREALRPVTPSEQFTQRLIATASAKSVQFTPLHGRSATAPIWWFGGLAASLMIAFGVTQHVHAQRELAHGLEARRQVLQALQVTRQKLDLAYEAVKNQSSAIAGAESGA